MTDHIQIIARAFIEHKGSILLAHNGNNFFLPGGHVDYNEPIKTALVRELDEEIALKNPHVGDFVGVIENSWNHKNTLIHEQCIIFEVSSPSLSSDHLIISQEPHISFHWQPVTNLKNINLLPQGLDEFLNNYLASGRPDFYSIMNSQ